MTTALLGASEAAKKALEALHAGERRFVIVGGEGTGKSGALNIVRDVLVERGDPVYRLAMPRGEDAAFAGTVALAAQLDPRASDLLPRVLDSRVGYDDKLGRVASALEETRGTLLIDDPPARGGELTASIFDTRLGELRDRLLQLREVRVVVASRLPSAGPSTTIRPLFDLSSVLAGPWSGALAPAARSLQDSAALSGYSPVEVRLIVAAVAAGQPPPGVSSHRWDPSGLLDVVLEGETELRRIVATLAFVRMPFDDALLEALGSAALPEKSRALLHEVLLLRTGEGRVLHGLIGRRARGDEWLSPDDRSRAHALIAEWHRASFAARTSAAEVPAAIAHEVELVHHLTEAGDLDGVFAARVCFPEQYDALGKVLSIRGRHADAVRAYERAIAFDQPERIDAYAHHYLAYNLDVLAEQEKRVLAEYTVARDAQPTHPWFWGRRICFLVTTGRLDEAMDAWAEAAARFQLDSGEGGLAAELHRSVAQLLVHRGQIAQARRVLRDVPRGARSSDWFTSLDGWLQELEAAERDELVFPPHIPPDERWDGPHLLRDPGDAERVVEWQPGRIAHADLEGIRVRVGKRDELGHVSFFYRDLSHDDLSRLTTYSKHGLQLPAGTFVELLVAKDGDATREQLLSWPRQSRRLPGLSPIFPRPDRYIRRALAGR